MEPYRIIDLITYSNEPRWQPPLITKRATLKGARIEQIMEWRLFATEQHLISLIAEGSPFLLSPPSVYYNKYNILKKTVGSGLGLIKQDLIILISVIIISYKREIKSLTQYSLYCLVGIIFSIISTNKFILTFPIWL